MIVVELADSEATLLLKLAQQRFRTLDKQLSATSSRNKFDEYHASAGAVSVLELAIKQEGSNASTQR